jgi:predicted DNA-binding WGR domain protein
MSLKGKTIVFTGTLEMKRADAQKAGEAAGAVMGSSVTKATDILVCGSGVGAKKTDDAEKKGVAVWSEAEFHKALGGAGGGASKSKASSPPPAAAKPAKRPRAAPASPPPKAAGAGAAAPAAVSPFKSFVAPTASAIGTVNPVATGIPATAHVLNDGDLFDVDLAFTDGATNSNKFYRMQLIESKDSKKYWMVQHWGRIGTGGQNQVKDFADKAAALKAFNAKFKSKAGCDFANRGAAASNGAASGKYRTLTEQRVAEAGGRIADAGTVWYVVLALALFVFPSSLTFSSLPITTLAASA